MTPAGKPNLEILDCTIRDGGYLNNWDFDKKIVKELYRNLSRAGVDYIEIGFRHVQGKDVGIWVSTPEELIHELFKDVSGAGIGLLVDLGKVDLKRIPQAKDSLVKLYRVACHKDQVPQGIQLCEAIKAKGYKVSLQLMGIGTYTPEEMSSLNKPLAESSLDYIYFADSYGSLFPDDIRKYLAWLKPTHKKIGFHSHNNLQLAFANTLEAIANGIDLVDGTVYGMGRGAGNLPLEVLIIYLEKNLQNKKYNSMPILDLIDRYFLKMHDRLKWGYNLPYMLSATSEIHPDYVKYMLDKYQYTIDDVVKVCEIVKGTAPIGFTKKLVDEVIESGFISPQKKRRESTYDVHELKDLVKKNPVRYQNRHKDRDFLILANGPSLKEHKNEIDEFIQSYNPVVMGSNYLGGLLKPHYHAFSNKKRFMQYIDQVYPESQLLLSTSFDEDFIRDYTDLPYEWLVHLNRISSQFDIVDGAVTSTCRTISLLSVAAAIVMGAKRIFIAGMDGYKSKENFLTNKVHFYEEATESRREKKDFRAYLELHNWNDLLLHKINEYLLGHNKEGVHIITPTSHKHFYSSRYIFKA